MPSSYTGSPTAIQAPGVQPAPGVAPIVTLPSDGDGDSAASIAQAFKELSDYVAYCQLKASQFGSGVDGALVFDGVATVAGLVPSASTYIMVRDIFATTLTVATGVTLKPSGFRIYCNETLVCSGSGKIDASTAAATTQTATFPTGGTIGANGGSGAAGGNGTNNTTPSNAGVLGYASAGGTGGASGIGSGGSSGTGGTQSSVVAQSSASITGVPQAGSLFAYSAATLGYLVGTGLSGSFVSFQAAGCPIAGGCGGGGASGSGGFGGGGGGGGGVLAIAAKSIVLASPSCFLAKGGGGAPGQAGNSGGGGGGGGGCILIAYSSASFGGTFTPSSQTAPGAGGSGVGSGTAGSAGQNGIIITFVVA